MQNYNKININKQENNTILQIVAGLEIIELFGNAIPYPNYHYYDNSYENRLVYCWVIDGFFGTKQGYDFLNDIIARFKLSCESSSLHSIKASKKENVSSYKLKDFQGLKSLASDRVKEKFKKYSTMQDYVFWCLKIVAEDMIKQNGLIVWSNFENFAFENFIDKAKDKSTLRAKCRNIYNWYFERDWKIGRTISKNKEDVLEYRRELARNLAAKKEEENYNKVANAISGLLADSMFRKKNGKWNAVAIAEYLNLDPRTVRKYLPKETLF